MFLIPLISPALIIASSPAETTSSRPARRRDLTERAPPTRLSSAHLAVSHHVRPPRASLVAHVRHDNPARSVPVAHRVHLRTRAPCVLPPARRPHRLTSPACDTADYESLYQWSIDHIAEFWAQVWDWPSGAVVEGREREPGLLASKRWDQVSFYLASWS